MKSKDSNVDTTIRAVCLRIVECINSKDLKLARNLFKFVEHYNPSSSTFARGNSEILDCLRNYDEAEIESKVISSIKGRVVNNEFFSKWVGFICKFLIASLHKTIDNPIEAFAAIKESYTNFLELYIFFDAEEFLGNILQFYFDSLLQLASKSDAELEKSFKKPVNVDDCGMIFMHFFSRFQSSEDKITTFFCDYNLIKVYFKLKTYRNANTLVGWVDRSGLDIEKMRSSSSLSYYFSIAKLKLLELDIGESRKYFNLAFKAMLKLKHIHTKKELIHVCPESQLTSDNSFKSHLKNKSLILEYLLILNLFYGQLVSHDTLKKYKLLDYYGLLCAFASGDISKFDGETQKLEERLINAGTFLIVEKLKAYTIRILVQRIFSELREEITKNQHHILKLSLIYEIANKSGYFLDFEDFEFYMISVIHKGLIKGYIHNEKKEIVFSKANPFPQLSEVFELNMNKII